MSEAPVAEGVAGGTRIDAWTDQHAAVLDRLHHTGVYRADGRRVPMAMRPVFQWLRKEMRRRVPGARGGSLVWLNVSPMLNRVDVCDWSCTRVGELCSKIHITPGKDWLRLSVPSSRVLLSDFDLWSRFVVRYRYVPASDEDQARWDDNVRRALNLSQQEPIPPINRDWPVPLVHAVAASWTRVFDIAPGRPTQGTVERIHLHDVVDSLLAPDLADVPTEYAWAHRPTWWASRSHADDHSSWRSPGTSHVPKVYQG